MIYSVYLCFLDIFAQLLVWVETGGFFMTALHVAILCFLTLTLTQCSLSPEDPKVTTAAEAYGTAELVQDIAHPRNIKIHY